MARIESVTYVDELVVALRARGHDDARIARILADVEPYGTDRSSLEAEFGSPASYADRFPRGPRRPSLVGMYIGTGLAVVWLVAALFAQSRGLLPKVGLYATGPALGFMVLGIAVSFVPELIRALKPLDRAAGSPDIW